MVDYSRCPAYPCPASAKSEDGVDSPIGIGAAAPPCDTGAFFAPAIFNGGRCWEAERLAGSYARSVNPAPPATICLTAVLAVSHRIGVPL